MRRIVFIFLAAMMSTAVCSAAMSNSKVRKETRFLTDKMAYELNLNTEQYNDVYEINYDFISGIRYLMDDVLRGEEWALNRYYDYLDVRNDDLRWVLSSRQYSRFMQAAYFYRPVYVHGGRWSFRIYMTYTNHNHFYFPRPYHYRTYCGGHYRAHGGNSYYRGRYHHPHYTGSWSIRNDKSYHTTRRSDFGSVTIRPDSNKRPAGRDDVYATRRSSSSSKNRISTGTRDGSTRRSSVGSGRKSSKEKVETTRTKTHDKSSGRGRVRTESKENKERGNASGVRSSESRRSSSSSTVRSSSSTIRSSSSTVRSSSSTTRSSSSATRSSSGSGSSRSSERTRR